MGGAGGGPVGRLVPAQLYVRPLVPVGQPGLGHLCRASLTGSLALQSSGSYRLALCHQCRGLALFGASLSQMASLRFLIIVSVAAISSTVFFRLFSSFLVASSDSATLGTDNKQQLSVKFTPTMMVSYV